MSEKKIRVANVSLDRVDIEICFRDPGGVIGIATITLTAEEAGELSIAMDRAVEKAVGKRAKL